MGTSPSVEGKDYKFKDHPHAYGDKRLALFVQPCVLGSSPRVWGQDPFAFLASLSVRIIPTRMGTRRLLGMGRRSIKDHPHAYGDKVRFVESTEAKIGSSPRVWGQVTPASARELSVRIIPTRMGTSYSCIGKRVKRKDHPHAYGDKLLLHRQES